MSKSILVVEDDDAIREACKEVLAYLGHEVRLAEDGMSAVQILRDNRSQRFDLILLDIMMPQMSGEQFVQIQESNPDWKDIPVVLMSALSELPSSLRGRKILRKPMNFQDLLEVVQ